jgi:N-acetylglucosamine kinase-like BadF-type ATPase
MAYYLAVDAGGSKTDEDGALLRCLIGTIERAKGNEAA